MGLTRRACWKARYNEFSAREFILADDGEQLPS
jgi:hypothetical protein